MASQYIDLPISSGGGATTWGSITGTLSSQTDLQTALNAKQGTITATTPLSLSAGSLTIAQAGNSSSGFLSMSNFNSFNNRVALSNPGLNHTIATWINSATLDGANSELTWDSVTKRMTVGLLYPHADTTLHVKSDVSVIVNPPTSISASLIQFNLPGEPGTATATTGVPALYLPNYGSGPTQDSGSSGYVADGSVTGILYRVTPYASDMGVQTYGVATLSYTNFTDNADGNPYGVFIQWSANSGGLSTIQGFVVERNLNGAGWDLLDVGNVSTLLDTNSGWTSGGISGPYFPDYVANGSTRNYHAYGFKMTPAASVVYSSSFFTYSYTDDGSGQSYRVIHSLSGQSDSVRVLGAANGSPFGSHYDSASFTEYSTIWENGDTVTPTTYGFTSNGSILTRTYDYYTVNGTLDLYSTTFVSSPTTDPNNGLNYYISISALTPNLGKVIRDSSAGHFVILTSSFLDDGITAFTDGTTVLPNVRYVGALKVEAHGTTTDSVKAVIYRAVDTADEEFYTSYEDHTASEIAAIKVTPSQLSIDTLALGILTSSAAKRFSWDGTGVSFFNQTPAAQQIGGSATAGGTYTATEQAMLQKVYDALRTFGLLS